MNNKLSITYSVLLIVSLFVGCRGPVKEETENASPGSGSSGQKYILDTKQSVVTWKGAMLAGTNSHTGYVHISKGELTIENGELTGGTVQVDMNTIEDETHARNSGLVKHLKDPDFFDVKVFPAATIVLNEAARMNDDHRNITGNLTIKGITHPVAFPAKIKVANGIFSLDGNLVIDRTKWGVRYKSGKFYDLLADETMSDYIEFGIKVVARKMNP